MVFLGIIKSKTTVLSLNDNPLPTASTISS